MNAVLACVDPGSSIGRWRTCHSVASRRDGAGVIAPGFASALPQLRGREVKIRLGGKAAAEEDAAQELGAPFRSSSLGAREGPKLSLLILNLERVLMRLSKALWLTAFAGFISIAGVAGAEPPANTAAKASTAPAAAAASAKPAEPTGTAKAAPAASAAASAAP